MIGIVGKSATGANTNNPRYGDELATVAVNSTTSFWERWTASSRGAWSFHDGHLPEADRLKHYKLSWALWGNDRAWGNAGHKSTLRSMVIEYFFSD